MNSIRTAIFAFCMLGCFLSALTATSSDNGVKLDPKLAKTPINEDVFWRNGLPRDGGLVFLSNFTARFIPDNIRALHESIEMFNRAHSHIAFGTFLWGDDVSGRATAGAAIDAVRAGKTVVAVIDGLDLNKPGYQELYSAMAREGVDVYIYHQLSKFPLRANSRFHDKAQMIDLPDGRMQIKAGGRNAMDHYNLGSQTFDLDVLLTLSRENGEAVYKAQFGQLLEQGSLTRLQIKENYGDHEHEVKLAEIRRAQELARHFFEHEMPKQTIAFKEVNVKRGVFARNRAGKATATRVIEGMIQYARKHLTMANAYLIPNKRQKKLIEHSIDQGVIHAYFTNYFDSTEHWGVVLMMMHRLHHAVTKGLGLFTRRVGEVHAKGTVMDNQWVAVGSVNFDTRSEISDEQNLVLLDSVEVAAQFENSLVQEMRAGNYQAIGSKKWYHFDPIGYCKKLLISPMTRWL